MTCLDGSIWAEYGDTYFDRFEGLLNRWAEGQRLLLVSKETCTEFNTHEVLQFEPTVVGGFGYVGDRMVRQKRLDDCVRSTWNPRELAQINGTQPAPPAPATREVRV